MNFKACFKDSRLSKLTVRHRHFFITVIKQNDILKIRISINICSSKVR